MTVTLCLSCSLRCSIRGLGVHSIGAFPRAPSVGCGLPYHIWSLLSGILLTTASGVSEVPLGRVWPSLPHLVSNSVGVCWQLHRGFSEVPIGRVWPDSNSLGVCWQLLRGFPRPPSVGCGLPYHISSLTLWESAGNCIGGFPRSPSVGCGLILTLWESAGNCIGGFRGPPRSGVAFPTPSRL